MILCCIQAFCCITIWKHICNGSNKLHLAMCEVTVGCFRSTFNERLCEFGLFSDQHAPQPQPRQCPEMSQLINVVNVWRSDVFFFSQTSWLFHCWKPQGYHPSIFPPRRPFFFSKSKLWRQLQFMGKHHHRPASPTSTGLEDGGPVQHQETLKKTQGTCKSFL